MIVMEQVSGLRSQVSVLCFLVTDFVCGNPFELDLKPGPEPGNL